MNFSSISAKLNLETSVSFLKQYISGLSEPFDPTILAQCKKIIDFLSKDPNHQQHDIIKHLSKVVLSLGLGVNLIGSSKNFDFVIANELNVKIGFDTKLNGKYLILIFTIINDSDKKLENVTLNIEQIPNIRVLCENNSVNIEAGESKTIEFALQLQSIQIPKIRCQFHSSDNSHVFQLPLTISDFCTETNIELQNFMKKWNEISSPDYQCEVRIKGQNMGQFLPYFLTLAFGCVSNIQRLPNGNCINIMTVGTINGISGFMCRVLEEFNEIVIQARCSSPEMANSVQQAMMSIPRSI